MLRRRVEECRHTLPLRSITRGHAEPNKARQPASRHEHRTIDPQFLWKTLWKSAGEHRVTLLFPNKSANCTNLGASSV